MFDIGFLELVLIGIVALLVVGPERLPRVARTTGLWVGRARNFVASVKRDIDQELKAEELQRVLNKQAQSTALEEIIEDALDPGSASTPVGDLKPEPKSISHAESDSSPEGSDGEQKR